MFYNLINNKPIEIYGKGQNIRDGFMLRTNFEASKRKRKIIILEQEMD